MIFCRSRMSCLRIPFLCLLIVPLSLSTHCLSTHCVLVSVRSLIARPLRAAPLEKPGSRKVQQTTRWISSIPRPVAEFSVSEMPGGAMHNASVYCRTPAHPNLSVLIRSSSAQLNVTVSHICSTIKCRVLEVNAHCGASTPPPPQLWPSPLLAQIHANAY